MTCIFPIVRGREAHNQKYGCKLTFSNIFLFSMHLAQTHWCICFKIWCRCFRVDIYNFGAGVRHTIQSLFLSKNIFNQNYLCQISSFTTQIQTLYLFFLDVARRFSRWPKIRHCARPWGAQSIIIGKYYINIFVFLAALGKSSNNACREEWRDRQCQTSTD